MKISLSQRVLLKENLKMVQVVNIDYAKKDKVFGVTKTTGKYDPDFYVSRQEIETDLSKWKL